MSTPDPVPDPYANMRWNTPLSEEHATLLLDRLDASHGRTWLDLGCGWGELLVRAVSAGPADATGRGVDLDERLLERGRSQAVEGGLADRVTFDAGSAAEVETGADRVLCIGSSHTLGGTRQMLYTLRDRVSPGGRVLVGDACWERPPNAEALEIFGDEVLSLVEVVEHARLAGWRVLHLSTADQREWDDFESTWRAARQEWLLAKPHHDDAAGVRDQLDTQLRDYVGSYRGVLGFAYLVLAR
ncbi:SAM-dependent methyltransferase [Pedococcus bigeumensis]|nr:methyltransferase domain-containing protein [Pedococcus bigeumensis]